MQSGSRAGDQVAADDDLAQLARGGRTNMLGFLLRLAGRIPFLLIAGRIYGPEALGRMAYAVLVVEFCAQLATMGLRRGLALHLSEGGDHPGRAWDGVAVSLAAGMLLGLLLLAFPVLMFPNSAPRGLERWLGLVVPLFALTEVMLAGCAYRFDVATTVRARSLVEPWALTLAALPLAWIDLNGGLLISYAIAMTAAFVTAAVPFARLYPLREWRPRMPGIATLARRNLPLAAADAAEWGSRRIDLAILGLFVGPATVGIYYVAQQLASLPQKLKTSFDPVLAPVITRNLERRDFAAIAAAVSQVGFWIIAAQAGVALALGIPGEAIMGVVGQGGVFVGGNGALALLLLAEVVAATAVVSEHALVYVAAKRNLTLSIVTIVLQGLLTLALLWLGRRAGLPETWLAALAALALVLSLAFAAITKSQLATRLLGAPIRPVRWPLFWISALTASVGWTFTLLPEWTELVVGWWVMLLVHGFAVWRYGFTADDRALFRARKLAA